MAAERFVGEYQILRTLGNGISGKVKLAKSKTTGQFVALKVMDKAGITQRQMSNLQREITAMKRVSHRNVLPMIDFLLCAHYPKRDGTVKDVFILVLELASGGELFDFMMYTGCFPEHIARAYFQMLIDGLKACHAVGVYHRDIKPENLLISDDFTLKVADFGLAAVHEEQEGMMSLSFTTCGTYSYMAPEVLQRRPYSPGPADIWSAGCVLFVMLAGFPPFNVADQTDWWFNQIVRGNYARFWEAHCRNANFSSGAMQFMSRLFVADPNHRISIEEIERDPWFCASPAPMALIIRDLQNRKAQVEVQKREEKEKELASKAGSGSGSGHFDPFASNVVRSVSGDISSRSKAPLYDSRSTQVVARYTHFYTKHSAHTICARIEEAFLAQKAVSPKVNYDTYKCKAVIPVENGEKVEVVTQVYQVPKENLHIVEVSRRAGRLLQFQQVYKKMCAAMSDAICAPPSSKAAKTDDCIRSTPQEMGTEDDFELSEEVTLI